MVRVGHILWTCEALFASALLCFEVFVSLICVELDIWLGRYVSLFLITAEVFSCVMDSALDDYNMAMWSDGVCCFGMHFFLRL